MQIATIIPAVGLAAIPVLALIRVIRHFLLKKELGSPVQLFPGRRPLHFFGILLCMPLLISLNFFRNFDVLTELAITGTGLLGFFIALTDILESRVNGLYPHALVWNGEVIRYRNLDTVTRIDPYSIEVIVKPRDRKIIAHSSQELIDTIFAELEAARIS